MSENIHIFYNPRLKRQIVVVRDSKGRFVEWLKVVYRSVYVLQNFAVHRKYRNFVKAYYSFYPIEDMEEDFFNEISKIIGGWDPRELSASFFYAYYGKEENVELEIEEVPSILEALKEGRIYEIFKEQS